MNYIFYDLETTGRSTHWDQIIQIAAIYTDSNLNIIDQINETCRLRSYCLPNPEALLVNKISIEKLTKSNLSLYQLVNNIEKVFQQWSPAIFIGYNSISYDEEILRNSFFSNLIDPYLTIRNNNLRADLINTVRASNFLHPEVVKSKISQKGHPILKLEQVAEVNGILNFTAHDALGDTSATIELSKLIKRKLPKIWKASLSNLKKEEMEKNIKSEPFCHLETYFGKTKAYFLSFLDYHPIYRWALCFDLSRDPNKLLGMEERNFNLLLDETPKIIRSVRLNKSPLILPLDYAKEFAINKEFSTNLLLSRHKFISGNEEIKNRILKYYERKTIISRENQPQVDFYAEETIYKKFISKSDSITANSFHKSNWQERLLIRNKFKDERLHYFANLIIYEEQPQLLEKSIVKKIERNICERLLSNNNEKWLTIYSAYKIIDDLREKYSNLSESKNIDFLNKINNYIEKVEKKIQKYTI